MGLMPLKKILNYLSFGRKKKFFESLRARRIGYSPGAFPLLTQLADKILAKEYVLKHSLEVLKVPKIYYQTDNPSNIPFDALPDRFMIKANHGNSMNLLVLDKNALDKEEVIQSCEMFLGKTYGKRYKENWYLNIERKVFAEELLEDLVDIRFHCLHGKVAYIEYDIDKRLEYAFLTKDWKQLHVVDKESWRKLENDQIPGQPESFSSIVADCEKLTEQLDYVRLDVYYTKGEYYFSEFTFAPFGLKKRYGYVPVEFEYVLAEALETKQVDYEKIAQFTI